jgi:hypothetical protein
MRVLLAVMLAASPAWAEGICENTPRQYGSPVLVRGETFAVPGTQAWCVDGARGTRPFVELRDASGEVEVVNLTAAALRKQGFVPLQRGKCTVRRRWGADELAAGWPARMLAIEIGGVVHEVGLVPKQRLRAVAIATHFAKPSVLVFVKQPVCNGPPPGRFGAKDKGTCYADDEPVIVKLDVPDCF